MATAFGEAAKLLEPDIRLGKVDSEEERSLATRFGIIGIPTMIVFREGREIARQRGAMETQDIVRWARSYERGS